MVHHDFRYTVGKHCGSHRFAATCLTMRLSHAQAAHAASRRGYGEAAHPAVPPCRAVRHAGCPGRTSGAGLLEWHGLCATDAKLPPRLTHECIEKEATGDTTPHPD